MPFLPTPHILIITYACLILIEILPPLVPLDVLLSTIFNLISFGTSSLQQSFSRCLKSEPAQPSGQYVHYGHLKPGSSQRHSWWTKAWLTTLPSRPWSWLTPALKAEMIWAECQSKMAIRGLEVPVHEALRCPSLQDDPASWVSLLQPCRQATSPHKWVLPSAPPQAPYLFYLERMLCKINASVHRVFRWPMNICRGSQLH